MERINGLSRNIARSTILAAVLLPSPLLAQDPCDSLVIHSVSYAPFTDTALQVIVENTSSHFFSYPQFSLIDPDGDTLARETVNFFGIGQGMQTHRMDLLPGMPLPETPFVGTLELLYFGMDGMVTCTFPIDTTLCSGAFCDPFQIFLYRMGSGLVNATFSWQVTNGFGLVMDAGAFALSASGDQQVFADLCLQPGDYTLHVVRTSGPDVEYAFGVALDQFLTTGPIAVLQGATTGALPFSLYPACAPEEPPCGEVSIQGISYAPFADSGILLRSHNDGPYFFSYPWFELLNADGDTVARENLNFFGLGPQGGYVHELVAFPGAEPPSSPFTGTVIFHHTGVFGDGVCYYPLNDVSLCPPEPCGALSVFALFQGSPEDTHLEWSVLDEEGLPIENGTLHLDAAGGGIAEAPTCLPPGNYQVQMSQAQATLTSVLFGVTEQLSVVDGPSAFLPVGGNATVPFTYYTPCIDIEESIAEPHAAPLTWTMNGHVLSIQRLDGAPLRALAILDATGRMVRQVTTGSSVTTIDLSDVASGVLLLRSLDTNDRWPAQRVVLP